MTPDLHDLDLLKLLVKGEPRTVEDVLVIGRRLIRDSSHVYSRGNAESQAKELLAFAWRIKELPAETTVLPRSVRDRFLSFVARRAAGEPLALITGTTRFHGMDLKVAPGVFIPREVCELTITRAVRRLRSRGNPAVLDLCTGIGAIAMAIAKELPNASVIGSDVADRSLRLARANSVRLGIRNVRFLRSDLFAQLPAALRGTIDLITGYTPFVPVWEVFQLPAEAREYEPVFSFTDMSLDGTAVLRAIIDGAGSWLRPGGCLLLQVASVHAPTVEGLMAASDMTSIKTSSTGSDEAVVEGLSPKRTRRSMGSRDGSVGP